MPRQVRWCLAVLILAILALILLPAPRRTYAASRPGLMIEWPTEDEITMLAKTIYGEARGVDSKTEQAAVVWCILNRVDDTRWPDSIAEVITQRGQFSGYSPRHPATQEHKDLALDVMIRWQLERLGIDVGRVLPKEYVFFAGRGGKNRFRTDYRGGQRWDWSLISPYDN